MYEVMVFLVLLLSYRVSPQTCVSLFDISPERSRLQFAPISYYSIKNRMYSLLEFLFINLLIVAASDYVKISNFHNFT